MQNVVPSHEKIVDGLSVSISPLENPLHAYNQPIFFEVPREDVHQGLQQRHLGMIALAGAIGYSRASYLGSDTKLLARVCS